MRAFKEKILQKESKFNTALHKDKDNGVLRASRVNNVRNGVNEPTTV